jgi:two-component sensor histidine kinase
MTSDSIRGVAVTIRFDSRPLMASITSTRRFIYETYEPQVGPDASSRLAMVVHELMENLAKYADEGPVQLDVEFLPTQAEGKIRVSAKNHALPSRLAELKQVLDELSSNLDPHEMYLHFMNKAVERSEGSGLGLARIRVEGEMEISYTIEGDELTIHAEARLPLRSE